MVNHWTLILSLLFLAGGLSAQSVILDDYVRQGLQHHAGIQAKTLGVQRQEAMQQGADRGYWPQVSFGATYTLAAGGREIAIPIGDLLNPVYSTLNNLTGTQDFPVLDNVSEQFFPNNFYDARLRVTQPLYNRGIRLNQEVQDRQTDLARTQLTIAGRDLEEDIRVAYLQYLQALDGHRILEDVLALMEEQLAVQQSLLRNDKILPGELARSEADLAQVRAQLVQAGARSDQARLQVNHLLGREPEAEVLVDDVFDELPPAGAATPAIRQEELSALQIMEQLQSSVLRREEAWRLPSLGLQLDLGSQAFDLDWGPYALLGVSLDVPIWNGGRQQYKIEEARLAIQQTALQREDTRRQLEWGLQSARTGYLADRAAYEQYDARLEAERRSYRETFRRYQEGQANHLELTDARNRVTSARLQQNIARFDLWRQWAGIQRLTSSSSL